MVVTPDLYCGAYLLSKGAHLEKILVNGQHKSRPTVLFVLGGDYDDWRLEPCCSDGGEFLDLEGAIISSEGARATPDGSVRFVGSNSGVRFPVAVAVIVKVLVRDEGSVEFRPRFIRPGK